MKHLSRSVSFVGAQTVGWAPEPQPRLRAENMPTVRCGVCMNNPQGYSTVRCPRNHPQPTPRPRSDTMTTLEEVVAAWNS